MPLHTLERRLPQAQAAAHYVGWCLSLTGLTYTVVGLSLRDKCSHDKLKAACLP